MSSCYLLYKELAERLVDWEDRQSDLIVLIEDLRSQGVKVTPMNDQDEDGRRFLLQEIDPFTFFGTFNRQIRDQERLAILSAVKKLLGADAPLPEDFDGIPVVNNQRSWFIWYQHRRGANDVANLWRIFRLALEESPLANQEFAAAFDDALKVRGVATNLTMGLFGIRPDTFLNLDATNRSYLDIKLPTSGLSSEFYLGAIDSIVERGIPLSEISHEAWLEAQKKGRRKQPSDSSALPSENNYWLVGAFWSGSDPEDQTQRFLDEGIWQNGYKDKYLDDVRAIQVGDRIGIKAAFTQKKNLPFDARGKTVSRMSISAIGTVVANRNDGRTVEVEWEPFSEPKNWYFFTNRRTIWKLIRDADYVHLDYSERLIDFAFHDAS